MSIQYNILYKGRKIHMNLTPEESTDILQEYAEKYYTNPTFDINDIELEEIL